eukprot:TRINITY_DN14433_c0_g1_i1.p1 TRINITY_DN14433_c0_g1~~TRINITY_DN14433_c0_g1_i1.p1  ORF type:complete len:943 (+),score=239.01 TRINITY_DN14433_c0_g1_i1:97-2925(+)
MADSSTARMRGPPATPASPAPTTVSSGHRSRFALLGMATRSRGSRRPAESEDEEAVQQRLKCGQVAWTLRAKALHDLRVRKCDAQRRRMDMALSLLNAASFVVVAVLNVVIWRSGSGLVYAPSGVPIPDVSADPDGLFWFAAACKLLLLFMEIAALVCVGLYYSARLDAKRMEWSQDLHKNATSREAAEDVEHQAARAYGFVSSSLFPKFLVEILLHLIFPYPWLTTSYPVVYQFLQVAMLVRVYVVVRFVHTSSPAFILRDKIRQHYDEFRYVNMKVDWDLSIKILFYRHSVKMTAVCCVLCLLLAAFALHILERKSPDPDSPEFGDFSNCLWFTFVTFTTIGYGDMTPRTQMGRFVTVILGVLSQGLIAVFGGVVTNKLAPSKQQQMITSYLSTRKGEVALRHAAASVVQSLWRAARDHGGLDSPLTPAAGRSPDNAPQRKGSVAQMGALASSIAQRAQELPVSLLKELHEHKRNRLYKSVKDFRNRRRDLAEAQLTAADPVVDVKLDQLGRLVEDTYSIVQELAGALAGLSAERRGGDAEEGQPAPARAQSFGGSAGLAAFAMPSRLTQKRRSAPLLRRGSAWSARQSFRSQSGVPPDALPQGRGDSARGAPSPAPEPEAPKDQRREDAPPGGPRKRGVSFRDHPPPQTGAALGPPPPRPGGGSPSPLLPECPRMMSAETAGADSSSGSEPGPGKGAEAGREGGPGPDSSFSSFGADSLHGPGLGPLRSPRTGPMHRPGSARAAFAAAPEAPLAGAITPPLLGSPQAPPVPPAAATPPAAPASPRAVPRALQPTAAVSGAPQPPAPAPAPLRPPLSGADSRPMLRLQQRGADGRSPSSSALLRPRPGGSAHNLRPSLPTGGSAQNLRPGGPPEAPRSRSADLLAAAAPSGAQLGPPQSPNAAPRDGSSGSRPRPSPRHLQAPQRPQSPPGTPQREATGA